MTKWDFRNAKSNRIMERGQHVWLSWFDYPNGGKWVVRYRGKYYYIVHDGTGNQFFCSHAPREISEKEAQKILLKHEKYQEGIEKFGWKELAENEIDELLEL